MYEEVCQLGQISIFFSVGNKPLLNWTISNTHGSIKRITDPMINSLALDFRSLNPVNDFIECPRNFKEDTLSIHMKYVVLVVKNMRRSFSFEIEVIDVEGVHRKFRMSTYTTTIIVHSYMTSLPLVLYPNWNTIVLNLAKLCSDCYGIAYHRALRVKIYASFSLRRVFFCDRPYKDEELPVAYRNKIPPNIQSPLV